MFYLARKQIKGVGRLGKNWVSPLGCFIISFSKKIECSNPIILQYLATLGLCEVLNKYNSKVKVKWPNDLFLSDKKLAGVLCNKVMNIKENLSSYVIGNLTRNWLEFVQ